MAHITAVELPIRAESEVFLGFFLRVFAQIAPFFMVGGHFVIWKPHLKPIFYLRISNENEVAVG